MKFRPSIFACLIVGFLMVFTSCVKDNEIAINDTSQPSTFISSYLIVTTLEASAFIDDSTQLERMIRVDTTYLNLISSDFFNEEMLKSNLSFQFKNSLDRDFRIDFEFLNDLDEVKFELHVPVSSGSKVKPFIVETSVIIESPELTSFKQATKLVYKITLLQSEKSLSNDSEGTLELQSDATYFFDI